MMPDRYINENIPSTVVIGSGGDQVDGKIIHMTVGGLSSSTKMVGVPFCPDLLVWEDIGAADSLRGRVVRGFFWLMRLWK